MHHPCSIVSFAGPMKDFAKDIFPEEYMNSKKEEVYPKVGVSYRDWAIATGDAWRGLNKEIFLNLAAIECEEVDLFLGDCTVLIDDLRYENEAKWVKDRGGVIVRLKREGIQYELGHATEAPIDKSLVDFDCSVDNVVELVSLLIDEHESAEVEK